MVRVSNGTYGFQLPGEGVGALRSPHPGNEMTMKIIPGSWLIQNTLGNGLHRALLRNALGKELGCFELVPQKELLRLG